MADRIGSLVARQRPNFTLEQPFYTDPTIFERDVERIVCRQWLFVDHASRIPNRGDYFVVELAGESIVVVREAADCIAAFYNVCRHRGSRICLKNEGTVKRFTCPYHSWSYGLDGRVLAAPKLPKALDKRNFPLHPCPVEVLDDLIFISLSSSPPDFAPVRRMFAPYIEPHRLQDAKIIARESYPTNANWKLVLENFLECYHCPSCHPEYTRVNDSVKLFGDGPEKGAADYLAYWDEWNKATAAMGHVVGMERYPAEYVSGDPHNIVSLDHPRNRIFNELNADDGQVYGAYRMPIKRGSLTTTDDGKPAAPLMGNLKEYDGGETVLSLSYLSAIIAANDYAISFRFTPLAPQLTDVEIIWMVRADALEGRDYNVERVKWLWHQTTVQDKVIVEHNQMGVNSRVYQPGPYSDLEGETNRFVRWYLAQVREPAGSRIRRTA